MSPHKSPVLCFFFGAIKLPATSSFPCPRLPLSLRPGRPTALWEKGCPPPAGGQGAECSLWTSPSQSRGFSSQGSSRSSPGTQDTRVPGSLMRPTLPQTLASFPGWSLLLPQPWPLLRAKPPALTPLCSSRSPDSAHPCHPKATSVHTSSSAPISPWSISEEAPQRPQGPPPVPTTTAQVWPRVRLGSQIPASPPRGLSQAWPQALPCSTAFTGSPLLSPCPQHAAPTALPPALRPGEAAPRQAPTSTGQTQGGRTSSAGSTFPLHSGCSQCPHVAPVGHRVPGCPAWTPGSLSAQGRQLPLKSQLPPPLWGQCPRAHTRPGLLKEANSGCQKAEPSRPPCLALQE